MTAAGLPLPLRGGEALVRYADGCSAVVPTAMENKTSNLKWMGACRFGLADGKGILVSRTPNNPPTFYEKYFRLGIMQPGIEVTHLNYGKREVIRTESFFAFNRPDTMSLTNWTLPASVGSQVRSLIIRHSTNPDVWSKYFEQIFVCHLDGESIAKDKLETFSRADQELLKRRAYCGSQSGPVRYVEHKRSEGSYPNERVLAVTNYLCRSEKDCREAWAAATAAENIEKRKAELTAAHEAFMLEWEARFAPLEAAFQAKLKRLSATTPPRRTR